MRPGPAPLTLVALGRWASIAAAAGDLPPVYGQSVVRLAERRDPWMRFPIEPRTEIPRQLGPVRLRPLDLFALIVCRLGRSSSLEGRAE